MSQLSFPLEIIDDGTGLDKQAHQAKCYCSNLDPDADGPHASDVFYCFWGACGHLHIQCYDCNQSYCPYQQCVPPPTAEIFQPE